MKKIFCTILFLSMLVSHAQGEANIWYFGENAGLDFNSGVPVALTNGQLVTEEGCATISNSSGLLLFYTDGITVYNRNHVVMVNGTGLMGHSSSVQSATIVPKPGSNHLFYIFTTPEESNPNGFRYSIVDMNLDGGNGAVTSDKNILVYTPITEHLGITKHGNGQDYWILIHGLNNNSFLAYKLTASGLDTIPITTNIGAVITGGNFDFFEAGSIKISPSGSKLAFTSVMDIAQLFSFNNNTGVLSNEITLLTETGELVGAAFSPDESLLYIANSFGKIHQFNLNASNISNSKITIHNGNIPGQMQVGPDNKIYIAFNNRTKLGVINNPNGLGLGCNFVLNGIDLAEKKSQLGLPSFNQSFFFIPSITVTSNCLGESASFSFSTNQTVLSATWNFGDGNTSNSLSPTHTYSAAGTYLVSVTTTSPNGTGTASKEIVISAVPTATQPSNILVCDANNDGFSTFDLTTKTAAILNGQATSQFGVRYFANATDYANNSTITTPTSFLNATAYQPQTIIAEVYNVANPNCKTSTSFSIQVFENPLPATTIAPMQLCDNTSFGTDADGKVVFNLTTQQNTILNGQAAANFTVSYYKNAGLTDEITNPSAYVNTNAVETIYVKMTNNTNATCFATTSFQIEVFSLPIINTTLSLKQCDDNNDGFSAFNLTEANELVVASTAGLAFSYFETLAEAQSNSNPILNFTAYTNQTVSTDQIFIRVQNATGCFRVATLNLIVSTTLIPATFQKTFTVCDDALSGSNTDGIATFDFSSATTAIQALFPAGQLLEITYYRSNADALAEQNPISNSANFTNTNAPNTQPIFVRVDSQLDNACLGLGQHITLKVEALPILSPLHFTHCDDDQDGSFGFDTTTLENTLLNGLSNVTLAYRDANNNTLPSPLPNPFNTASQIVKVTATNNTPNACFFETTITFKVDDLPQAFAVPTSLTTVCDDESNPIDQDGFFAFDTSGFQTSILGTQTGMIVHYFDGLGNPLASPLPNPFTSNTQNIKVEVSNPQNTTCNATTFIPFVVNPIPEIALFGDELICSDNPSFTKIIDAGLLDETTILDFTYQWFLNGVVLPTATNYELTVNTAGIYTVEVTNAAGCKKTRTITVIASDIATINDIAIKDLSTQNSVTILVSGLGNYEYSLDNTNFQASNVFQNVAAGIYTVYVRDLNGCGIAKEAISVLGYPDFFTPNNDGTNDFWNVNGVNTNFNTETTIAIFDRYGKFIKQITPLDQGWDGTFNGTPLPASDYWFTITLERNRKIKGHFALKR